MLPNNVIQFEITDNDLQLAVEKALRVDFIDNLRDRATFVKLDSKIRGYLGEIGMNRFLTTNGITVLETDRYEAQSNEDKDVLVQNDFRQCVLEIKTSLIPDVWGTLEEVLKRADIKIIKRENDYHYIKADFHLQIYFNQCRKKRDEFLKTIAGSPVNYNVSEIIEVMNLRELKQVFVAWVSKTDLIAYLDRQVVKTWNFMYRDFWKCPLTLSKEPNLLIDAIKNYQ